MRTTLTLKAKITEILEASFSIALTQPPTVLSVSSDVDKLLGFKQQDFVSGKQLLQSLIHPHDQDIADALFLSEIQSASTSINIRLRHADGRIRCIKGQYTKVKHPATNSITLELLLQDAKSLWQQQGDQTMMANFKAMMDNTDDYIYFKDRNHVFNGASQALVEVAESIQHWTEFLGLTDYDVFLEEYADIYYSLEKQVFAGVRVAHEIQETRLKDGSKGWVSNRKYPIKNDTGEIIGLFGIARDITEKKLAEDALASALVSAETKFRTLYDSMGDAILMLDEKGFFDCNQVALDLFGLNSQEELRQYPLAKLSPPTQACGTDSMTLAKRYIDTAMQVGKVRFEWIHQRVDTGKTFIADILLTPLTLDGQLLIQGTVRDISERKQAEVALKESEFRWKFAIEGSGDGVWDWNIQTDEAHYSKRWKEMLGYNDIDILSTNDEWFRRVHPDDQLYIKNSMQAYLEGKTEIYVVEYRLRCKDDSYKWILGRGMIVSHSEDGKPLRMIGTHTDITERKQAEEKLQLSSRVFNNSLEGIIITNAQQEIIDVNPAFSDITGYSREEIIGQNPKILTSGRQSPEIYQAMWQEVDAHGFWQGEVWNRKKEGELYAELLSISVLKNEQDEITHYISIFSDITSNKQQQEKLNLMAHYDMLTGLPNRSLFADRFAQAIAYSKRTKLQLAICFLDLDNFKPVNDHHGHEAGDQLLIEVAKRIKANVREVDTVSRQGGDEFALLLNDIESYDQCEVTLERILYALAQPYVINDRSHTITASIGVTLYPDDNEDIDTLIRHADKAMYQAKLEGKHRYHVFDSQQDKQLIQKHHKLDEIQQALINNEFQLYYQPKVNMLTGEVFGAEALIRWIHPEKGIIPPLDFLPLIDGTDLELQIGDWVINQALQQMNSWLAQDIKLEVSVNIASHHLQSAAFVANLEAALALYPAISPACLQLEILESSALCDLHTISQIIKTCQEALGVNVALDDFGTGYSSLTHLRNLTANTIKIDQSFVRDMLDDPDDYTIIDGVIGLAESFGREVIAEGVETTAHGLMLQLMGCKEAQGYGIAKPMPANNIPEWLSHYQLNQQWLACGQQVRTVKESKIMLFRLITNHWKEVFIAKVLSSPDDKIHWPIMDSNYCPCGTWIKWRRKEQLFASESLNQLNDIHDNVHTIAQAIHRQYQQGHVDAAREALSELQSAFDEMSSAVGLCE